MSNVKYAASQTKALVKDAEFSALAMATTMSENTKAKRVLRVVSILSMLSVMLFSLAFAATDIKSGIKTGAGKVWDILKAIVLPLGAVAIAICFLWILFDGERGMEKGKKYLLRVIIVVAVVFLAPLILNEIGGWFPQSNWDSAFTH